MDDRSVEFLLFRPEAVTAQSRQPYGPVRIFTPLPLRVLAALSGLVVAGLVCLAVFGGYARVSRSAGVLVPVDGLFEVVSPSSGVVEQIDSQQGEEVARGQRLATLVAERRGALAEQGEGRLREELAVQMQLLQRSALASEESAVEQRQSAQAALAILSSQKEALRHQVVTLKEQQGVQLRLREKLDQLRARQFVSVLQVQQHEAAIADTKNQISTLLIRIADIDLQMSRQREQARNAIRTLQQAENELGIRRSTLAAMIDESAIRRNPAVVAPSLATVASVNVKRGQSVSAGEVLLTLIPTGSPLQAELLVRGEAIGSITLGQSVTLRYAAFPYQHFGSHGGSIISIAQSALSPVRASGMYGKAVDTPIYRVMVRLDSQVLRSGGKTHKLLPGMEVDGHILLERRTLLDRIVAPVRDWNHRLGEKPA